MLPGTPLWTHNSLPLYLLVDSGADDKFIDESLAKQALIPFKALPAPRTILDLDGKPIARVTHPTRSLTVSGNHHEQICLVLIPSSAAPAVLDSPWLMHHNPQLDWANSSLTGWSIACHSCCLHSVLSPSAHASSQLPEPVKGP